MADLSDASDAIVDELSKPEEYEHDDLRVKRGRLNDRTQALLDIQKLNALAARSARGSIFSRPILAERTR